MEFVQSADGTRIAYQRTGEGPALVLVHGTASDHTMWTGVLPVLAERFTVYTIDRRGYGASGARDGAQYTLEREFADIEAILDAVDAPAYLLGHSYGAICALEAARLTDNLHKLVLYEPPIPFPPGSAISPPGTLARMEALLEAGDQDGVMLTFAREIARLPEGEINTMRSSPAWPIAVSYAPNIIGEVRAVDGYIYDPARFYDLATSTLMMMGDRSPSYLKDAGVSVAATLPDSQQTVLSGQGHLAMFTAPDLFLREVIQFLNGEEGRDDKAAEQLTA